MGTSSTFLRRFEEIIKCFLLRSRFLAFIHEVRSRKEKYGVKKVAGIFAAYTILHQYEPNRLIVKVVSIGF